MTLPPPTEPPAGVGSERRSLLKGAGFAMAGFLIRPLSRVPMLLIVGQLYGESAFGRYVFAIGVFEATAAFARLGLRDTLFRFLAEAADEPEAVLADALALAGGLALAAAAVLMLGAPLIGAVAGSADLWAALGVLAPVLPVFVLTDILLAATRAQRAVGYEVAARSLLEPAVLTLGMFALGLTGWKGGLLAAYAAAQAAALAVAVAGVARRYDWSRLPKFDVVRMRRMAGLSAPTGLADCMILGFNTIGVVTAGHLLGAAAVGSYGMAMSLETALSKIRAAFDLVVVPASSQWIAHRTENLTEQFHTIARWVLSAQLPGLGVVLLIGDLVLGLFGKGFAAGAHALWFLALAAVIDGTANLAQVPLFLTRPRLHFLITLLTLLVHASLSWLLAPRLGLTGTGVSLSIAWVVAGTLRQIAVRRLLGRWLIDISLLKPIAAFGLGLALAKGAELALPGISRWWAGLGFLATYAVLLGALEPDLRRRARAAVAGRLSKT